MVHAVLVREAQHEGRMGHTTLARPIRRSQESRPPRPTLRAVPGVRAGLRRAAAGVARKRRRVAGVRAGVLAGANLLVPPRRMPASAATSLLTCLLL